MGSHHSNSRSKPEPPQIPINLRWCNRALRPLTSIYLRLEKHWKISPLRDEEYIRRAYGGGGEGSFDRIQNARRSASGSTDASDSESSKEDPTWVPGDAVRKPIKHRYSGRRDRPRTNVRSKVVVKSPEAEKLQPGQLTIATPLILGKRRMINPEKAPAPDDDSSTGNETFQKQKIFSYSKHKSLGNSWSLSEIAHGIEDTYNDPSYVAIVQTIFSAWDTFLRMSTPRQNHHDRGAKSLLSMALSTTSKYILQEQERVNSLEDKGEETDVAGFIITELEKMYAMGNNGWKPLKELVRSHGIHLMCEAIRKRWLSPQLSRRIVLQSFSLSAHDAAAALLSALISLSPVIPPPIRLDCNLFKSSHSVALCTLETLPAEWLATNSMKYYLTAALQSLAIGDEHSFASLRLISSAILAAAGSKKSIPARVLNSLRRSKRGNTRCRKIIATQVVKELVKELAGFVLQIARCLGRVRNDNGFEAAKRFTLSFNFSGVKGHPVLQIVLSKVAIEVALKFAEATCLQEHHDWASYIQDQVAACDFDMGDLDEMQPMTPSLRRSEAGFRWEDGIGEWVAKTPSFSQTRGSRSTSPLPNDSDSHPQIGISCHLREISDTEESDSGFSTASTEIKEISSVSSGYSVSTPPPKRKRLSSTIDNQNSIRVARGQKDEPRYQQQLDARRWSPNMDALSDMDRQRSSRGSSPSSKHGTSDNVAVVIEVPRRPKVCNLEVVVLKERSVAYRKRHATEPPGAISATFDISDQDDDDEDILNYAPVLSQRLRHKISPHQIASRQPQTCLKVARHVPPRRSTRLSFTQRVVPCSDGSGSSDDELSFC
ncbi:conserved hypothetical protein [Microsporum canis CBS 113480]|uniref:Uncharacterized protein n=1 Tax=Arthroderma otae (strain ATCC MYA-4605 / CBS 113480) TaxID=554155 RepID=C5FDG3_ARTOC|nr:conserved hypothetical protein [Microsporum canis CBS 113480]EEQ27937.1 conserved hypothetical protein [Microsporum canis CBS 113480]